MQNIIPHHIIAIGASAGGMEEINLFFDHTPLDGVAYVIIQHLSSDFKSRMVELLGKHSKLEVLEAEEGVELKSNRVYLIPNDKFMTISNGHLHLTDKDQVKGPHLTINAFFNSLAEDCGSKAIAVVLSGLGSDGTEGIKRIKKAGGMVIARDPETTDFGSMPTHAIATGLVDFILEPAAMPEVIEEHLSQGLAVLTDQPHDERHIKTIIELINERSPLDFSDYKLPTIIRRTKRRANQGNFISLEQYLNFLRSNPEEIEALAKDFLISVTSYFRDKNAFAFLKAKVIPDILLKAVPGEELKMWIAGCATGEEAYSMAILVAEQLTIAYKDIVVKIFATDIDSAALNFAGKAIYTKDIEKQVSTARLEKYFVKEGEGYRVKPEIRNMVIFAQHDLVKNPPYCNMDMISCRNLLIYMTPVLQKKVFSMMLFGLKVKGYLFLGTSENPMPIINNLEVIDKKWKIYRNLKSRREVSFDAFSLPELLDIKRAPAVQRDEKVLSTGNTLSEAMGVQLADERDYLAIGIDENNQVVKTYGSTKYLLQQNFNLDLLELLPKPLAVAFITLKRKVMRSGSAATLSGIKIKTGDSVTRITMTISPLNINKNEQKLLMVTISKYETSQGSRIADTNFDEKIFYDQYTLNLEEELKELQVKLNSAYERLDASNENMQSFNEELISANEEMQSTNEEMQSVNEELHTINADYQLKNKELLEINDDLNNYFRSNVNGQLFIDNDLLLMKFSPGTVNQINLLESDIGRPLSNISTNIKFETIIDDIKLVLQEGNIITKEIETTNGKWYQIMTMPYIQLIEQKRSGAIVTFNDITELKGIQTELDRKNKSLERINADLDDFVHTASHELLAPLVNIETSIGVMNLIKVQDPELSKFVTIINLSVRKFRSLINGIATISRMESDTMPMEVIDLNETLAAIERSLDTRIKQTGTTITSDIEVDQVIFSKKNLRGILVNLVGNGMKFNNSNEPLIHISIVKNADHLIFSVTDNGIGIAQDQMEMIFSSYGRFNKEPDGQGIALYLGRKIINAANGEILVKSEVGKGSTFTIRLPVAVAMQGHSVR